MTFLIGDLAIGTVPGVVQHSRPDGTFVEHIETVGGEPVNHCLYEIWGPTFDADGNLYVMTVALIDPEGICNNSNNIGVIQKFANDGTDLGVVYETPQNVYPLYFSRGGSLGFDRDGNFLLLEWRAEDAFDFDPSLRLKKIDPSGTLLNEWIVDGEKHPNFSIAWLDVARDGHTIAYTTWRRVIHRFDTSTGLQLDPIINEEPYVSGDPTFGPIRYLPNDDVLLTTGKAVRRYQSNGVLVNDWDVSPGKSPNYGLALDIDGEHFWVEDLVFRGDGIYIDRWSLETGVTGTSIRIESVPDYGLDYAPGLASRGTVFQGLQRVNPDASVEWFKSDGF